MTDLSSSSCRERLVLADDLHLTWDRHLLTVASARWEPGLFLYDVEYLTVEAKSAREGMKVALGSRGVNFTFQVVRFELDLAAFARFDAFIARVRAYRDELRVGERRSP